MMIVTASRHRRAPARRISLEAGATERIATGALSTRFALFWVMAAILYVVTAPGNHADAEDAFMYAYDVETKPYFELFNPYHALYLPLMKILFQPAQALGLVDRPFGLMQAVSILCAASTIALFDLTLRKRLGLPAGVAAVGSALLALSYGFWRYASEVEIYAPAALLSVALFYAALRPELTTRDAWWLGVLAAAAISMHALNSALACVVVPTLLIARGRWRLVPIYAFGAATILVPLYTLGLVARLNLGGAEPETVFYGLGESSLAPAAWIRGSIGLGRAIASGMPLFAWPDFVLLLAHLVPSMMPDKELFIVNAASPSLRILGWATMAAAVAAAALNIPLFTRRRRHCRAPAAGEWSSLLWLAAYAPIPVLISPTADELWILFLVPFWLLITSLVIRPIYEGGSKAPIAAMVALFGLHNFVGGIGLVRDELSNLYKSQAHWLIKNSKAGDTILTFDRGYLTRYIRYYSSADIVELFPMHAAELGALRERLERHEGAIYTTPAVFSPPHYECLVARLSCELLQQFAASLKMSYALMPQGHGTAWALRPRSDWGSAMIRPSGRH